MKTLFIVLVLMAAAYLLVPKSTFDSMSKLLPSQKIEQAASTLLSNVDKKLEAFKQNLTAEREQQVSNLENKIAQLEQKVAAMESLQPDDNEGEKAANKNEMLNTSTSIDINLADKPALQFDENVAIQASERLQPYENNEPIETTQIDNEKIINRKAALQDIAERMNRTSLMALTK